MDGAARHEKIWRDVVVLEKLDAPGGAPATEANGDQEPKPKPKERRVVEFVLLQSIGEPLSQCGTVRDLLMVMYDSIESEPSPASYDTFVADFE